MRIVAVAALVLVLALGGLTAVLMSRIDTVAMPELGSSQREPSDGTVYLFVGADSGIERAPSDVQRSTPEGQARADALVLVRLGPDGTASAVSVPRDLTSTGDYFGPLALALLEGPDVLMQSVCSTMGVAVDRYVSIDATGFVGAIDALGGIEVDIEHPIRDPAAELGIDTAGPQRVDGATALGLVRSRHAEELIDGTWVRVSDDAGAQRRALWSGRVLDGVRAELSDADAAGLAGAVWSGSESLSIGGGLHPFELARLARADLDIHELPAEKIGDARALKMGETAKTALADAGFRTDCTLE
ncbi:LCP family protein [Leucobacter sp. USCH14]|uniref:LCP family protein n=1 Tax=Leucobacter sp. USCH14 TaxID=3024838 RepID=UPI0030B27259